MLEFAHPGAFLFFLVFPLFFLLRRTGLLKRFSFPLILADWGGESFNWQNPILRLPSFLAHTLALVSVVAVIIAMADPLIVHQEKVYTTRGSDILFVVDTSPSMSALDIGNGTRLAAAISVISNIAREVNGVSFSLVAMGSEAALIVPPTQDTATFLARLNALKIGELGDGTAIGTGLSTGVYHLSQSTAPQKCIILLTDGENNSGAVHPMTAAQLAANNGITVYTVALGTEGSVPVEYVDPLSGKMYSGYLESHFDASFLSNIASVSGGTSFSIESLGALSDTLNSVVKKEAVTQSYQLRSTSRSYHEFFLHVAVASIIIAWLLRRWYLKELI